MSKAKTILSAVGAVSGLLILAELYFTWSSFNAKSAAMDGDDEEGIDGLETVMQRASSLSRKKIYPCKESLQAIAANRETLAKWREDAFSLACRGDRAFPKTTPAAFKAFIVDDAKRLRQLPGGRGGKIVAPEFAFGPFSEFIAEGKMPAEAELAALQRRWDDVAEIVTNLAAAGICEITDISIKANDAPAKDSEKNKNRQNRRRERNKPKDAVDFMDTVAKNTYIFSFAARPSGLVAAINTLEVSERFIVVDDFTFARKKDAIAEALGGGEKLANKPQAATGSRRSRRRVQMQEASENQKDSAKGSIVTDPMLDAPLSVTMTVSVYDFKSLEKEAK